MFGVPRGRRLSVAPRLRPRSRVGARGSATTRGGRGVVATHRVISGGSSSTSPRGPTEETGRALGLRDAPRALSLARPRGPAPPPSQPLGLEVRRGTRAQSVINREANSKLTSLPRRGGGGGGRGARGERARWLWASSAGEFPLRRRKGARPLAPRGP